MAFVALALLGCALLAPAARAEAPASPVFVGTNPESPGLSTSPRIIGRGGGIGTSVLGSRSTKGGLSISVLDPGSTVRIYATSDCSGTAVASGPISEFETKGIGVTVASDSTTMFYGTLEDPTQPGEVSLCSSPGLSYRQVGGPPDPPALTAVTPDSPADDNFPHVIGDVDPETTVDLYTDSKCAGVPVASGLGAELRGGGVEVEVADNSTSTFYATASWAGFRSECSTTSVAYQESTVAVQPPTEPEPTKGTGAELPKVEDGKPAYDPPGNPPAPKLRVTPATTANDNTPIVTGKAANASRLLLFSSAGCKGDEIASGTASQFAGDGITVNVADNTTTMIYGVSVDGGGDHSPCTTDPVVYTEDSTLPHTVITGGPAATTKRRKATFQFADTSEDPSVSFYCRVDKRAWKSCHAPFRVKGLTAKRHSVSVKAVDGAGNTEPKPALRRFKVVR